MKFKQHPERRFRHFLSMPFIYGMIIPAFILDIGIEIYHHLCFPLYGLGLISRTQFIKVDRQKLSYLTPLEKLNCMYCGYVNGLFAYAVRIAGETEKYWCGIKHQKDGSAFIEPPHHKDFIEFGDKKAYQELEER